MPLSAILTPVPHPGLVGPALAAARGGDPLIIATPASFPLRVATQDILPWVDNPDLADPLAPAISVSLPTSCWQLLAGQISLWDVSFHAQIICGHVYTEPTVNALMDCAIDVGGLKLVDLGTPVTNVYWTLYSDHTSGSKWSYVAHISYEWPLDTCLRHILISNSHICEQNTVYREHSFHCTI